MKGSNGFKICATDRRKFIRNSAMAAAAITLSPFLPACKTSGKKPNIVYVFADQWRGSATGYGVDPNVKTPNLDRLAEESINFRNTVSVCPVCTPYRAALMTGRYPTSTGMFLNDLHLPSDELCMPEIFKNAGYNTGYIGKWHLDGHGRRAFIPPERRQGWEYWKAAECDHSNNQSHYYAQDSEEMLFWEGYDAFAQTKDAQRYIHDHAGDDQPFILMLSFGPPHPSSDEAPEGYRALYTQDEIKTPPNVPAEDRDAAQRHLYHYYSHCTALDHCVGELMQSIGEAGIDENTIFVFTSDHGGMLLSHGLPQHWKQVAWGESAHVPFLIRYPAAHGSQGRTVDTPLNTPDILPTLLGLAGVRVPGSVEGDDLSSLIYEVGEIEDRTALYMSIAPFVGQGEAHRSIRTKRYTYVRNLDGPFLLFDDREDPWQIDNLAEKSEYETVLRELDSRLMNGLAEIGDDFRPPDSYIDEWGYEVEPVRRAIPYQDFATEGQSPKRKS